MSVRGIALATVRDRTAGFVGVFLAILCASVLVTALGVLMESGLRGGLPPQRYAGASVVVGGPQTLPVVEDVDTMLSERARLPVESVDEVAAMPGVAYAAGDVDVPVRVRTDDDVPTTAESAGAHGWRSAALAPFVLREGTEPRGDHDAVLESSLAMALAVTSGDQVELAVGGVPSTYTVVGVAERSGTDGDARASSVFLTDDRARQLSGHPDRVDAIGVVAEPGADLDALAELIESSLAEAGARTYLGDDRAVVEFLDVSQARDRLVQLSGALGGTSILVAMFVVATTMALSIQQRRREFALLRAIAASKPQIHRMVRAEVLLVGGVAAVAGVLPGYAVALLFTAVFADVGFLPPELELALSPLPGAVAITLCLVAALLDAWIAARRPTRMNPIEALGDAAAESPELPRGRVVAGWVMTALGLASSTLPWFTPGLAAVAAAGSSVLLLVIAVALLGPRLLGRAAALAGGPLARLGGAPGFLASANGRAQTRRLAAAVTPIVLGIAFVSVQVFSGSTISAAAVRQTGDGVVAEQVVVGGPDGLGSEVRAALAEHDAVQAATPVVRSQVVVRFRELGDPVQETFAVQGIDVDGIEHTLDLDVRSGDLGDLSGETVALSELAAQSFGASLGDRVSMVLGDGTEVSPRVVAVYGRGLGFGDLTLPYDVLVRHTTTGRDDLILLAAAGAGPAPDFQHDLRRVLERFRDVSVIDAADLAAAGAEEQRAESTVGFVAILAIMTYIAIAVVNTLVMATAERSREFAMLRLVGARRREVARMMRLEACLVVGVATVVGVLVALPPLVGISLGLTGSALPSVPPMGFAVVVGTAALLGFGAIGIPTRIALRARPVDVISLRDS